MPYFTYGEIELRCLKRKDKTLGEMIDRIGPIQREVIPDLFEALVNAIVGQQISTKAQETIWIRMKEELGMITPELIDRMEAEDIQKFGISMRKAGYIKNAAKSVLDGKIDLGSLEHKHDDDVRKELSSLKGVGVWTADMLMIFSMQRQNILSFDDLAIQRALRMLYHHRKITHKFYMRYKRRYSPYASVASLYLWEIAAGAIPELRDYAPKSK